MPKGTRPSRAALWTGTPFAFWFAGFASPDVIAGAIWQPALLELANGDAVCASGSGAARAACSADSLWNDTLWRSLGGSECETPSGWSVKYTHEGCTALAPYQSATGYTCNCTGDYSFLPSGVRPGTVYTNAAAVTLVTITLLTPVYGVAVDHSSRRKTLWMICRVRVLSTPTRAPLLRLNPTSTLPTVTARIRVACSYHARRASSASRCSGCASSHLAYGSRPL